MWINQFEKKERSQECLGETTTLHWHGRWLRMEFIRKDHPDNDLPGTNYTQFRDLETYEVVSRCMEGFELHSAFVWGNSVYVFATDYWNIYMSKSFDLAWWSKPIIALNNNGMPINHQNNSICFDGDRFIMAVDLLSGPYNFTVCFAFSYNLQDFQYIPGAVYRADLYTSSPRLYFNNGWYYLIHVRNTNKNRWWRKRYLNQPADYDQAGIIEYDQEYTGSTENDHRQNWWFEQFLSRSSNLLTWEDAPHNPILSPDPSYRIRYLTGGSKPECCVGDLNVYERNGITIGDFGTGTQEAGSIPTYQHAEYPGSLTEFFESFYQT